MKIKEKIIILIALIIVTPLLIIAIITDIFTNIYIYILRKFFKINQEPISFTYLILFWEKWKNEVLKNNE